MKLIQFGLLFLCLSLVAQNTVNYTSSSEIFANPERGFQKYSITDANYATTSNYSNISVSELNGWYTGTDKVSVIFRYFLLEDFLSTNINATYLSNMQLDFDRIKSAGFKCIIRFSYSNAEGTTPQQAAKAQIVSHIAQLQPILNQNKDIIVSHQAGFIGTWGEWYYTNSSEFGTEGNISPTQWLNRKEVVDAMLNATPVEIPIQLRYPLLKKTMYGNTPLTPATAYQNTALARIGFFNDAFLNDYGDQGTYEVSSQYQNPVGTTDYVYLSNETQYVPMSGETNGLNAPRTNGSNAVLELDYTNWSLLNRDYFEQNITNWTNSNHIDEIKRKLGYRFVLTNSTFDLQGTNLNVQMNLTNEGYARVFKARDVLLILKNNATSNLTILPFTTDIRTWENTVSLNQTFDISSLADGTYTSYLFIPDSGSGMYLLPKYAIRFANNNVWEASSGMNNLSQTVVVGNLNATNFDKNTIQIYPNPATSFVTVSSQERITSMQLFNTVGQRVFVKANGNVIDVSFLPVGTYFLHLETENGKVVKKINKQ
ncbi:conserved exported hypothetical protein [Flavobacterium sp. 9AF]|uniref:DUF4832 domain-containing protein n=1 Tax=Flavobacterium sp. 9AF TaxID=2653142 RepID=UPI0012F3ECC1|nr:DUF4832 domain-containing protein [Flavobacterium sp. 9AF]VXC00493.1 conserved exported hypothetical protein [Flavobacterium sp. 9AF]